MEAFVSDISERAAVARRKWKSDKARVTLLSAFATHNQQLSGEWCDLEETAELSQGAARLGGSSSRLIQRWPEERSFIETASSCMAIVTGVEHIYVLVMDISSAPWVRVEFDLIASELLPAVEWLSDGFIAFDPILDSLISVDVEGDGGARVVETTIIGDGFSSIRSCFEELGPPALHIVEREVRHPNGE